MVPSPTSTQQRVSHQTQLVPLSIIRTETVLSRFPIHNLTKRERVTIRLQRTNAHGELDFRWEVSYNERYGPPRQLAYKLDTIVINQLLDTLPRPLPSVLNLRSMSHVCGMLSLDNSGRQHAELKNAFHQNASAYIVAYLRYHSRDGTVRIVNTGFTRYSVTFTGERLPNGTKADAIYISLKDEYRDILNHAPVRPLNYAYLKALTPTAQRFYEILSYKMFAALKHRHPHATLRYTDYCLLSTQQRYTDAIQVQKQMYKVHRPHVQAGYLTKVRYEATTAEDGQPDWLLHYTPGPKARAEYAAFMHQRGADVAAAGILPADADQEDLLATVTREPPMALPPAAAASTPPSTGRVVRAAPARPAPLPAAPPAAAGTPGTPPTDPLETQALALVQQFYQRFSGRTTVTPGPKELAQALELLTQHGAAKAQFLLAFAHQEAPATDYTPQVFGGILPYLPRALAAYEARATQAATQRAAAAQRAQREQYQAWEQHEVDQLRAALPPAELAAREAEARARLIAAGTPAVALPLAVRVAVDTGFAAQAGLPSFEVWRQAQEAGA
jgi:hypothetical protein